MQAYSQRGCWYRCHKCLPCPLKLGAPPDYNARPGAHTRPAARTGACHGARCGAVPVKQGVRKGRTAPPPGGRHGVVELCGAAPGSAACTPTHV